jgi:hypothetical protein
MQASECLERSSKWEAVMTDRDQLDRIIDGLGYYYWNTVRLTETNDDIQPKRDKLSISIALSFAGLDWIKTDQRWNIKAEKDAKQAAHGKTDKTIYGNKGNE